MGAIDHRRIREAYLDFFSPPRRASRRPSDCPPVPNDPTVLFTRPRDEPVQARSSWALGDPSFTRAPPVAQKGSAPAISRTSARLCEPPRTFFEMLGNVQLRLLLKHDAIHWCLGSSS